MVETPVRASLSISSIFVARGIVFFSFCRPSRGPTSTSLTRLSYEVPALAVAKPLCQRSCPERRHARQMLDRKRLMVKVVVGLCLTGSGGFNCKRERRRGEMVSTRPMSTRVSSASAGAELQPRSPRYNLHHRPLQAMDASLVLLRTVPHFPAFCYCVLSMIGLATTIGAARIALTSSTTIQNLAKTGSSWL